MCSSDLQSLVILVPSCKDASEVKQYELQENRCKVGHIEVATLAGTVTLDKAFEGTFVTSVTMPPTPPVVMNITEGKIGNNLIIVKPAEIQRAVRELWTLSDSGSVKNLPAVGKAVAVIEVAVTRLAVGLVCRRSVLVNIDVDRKSTRLNSSH